MSQIMVRVTARHKTSCSIRYLVLVKLLLNNSCFMILFINSVAAKIATIIRPNMIVKMHSTVLSYLDALSLIATRTTMIISIAKATKKNERLIM